MFESCLSVCLPGSVSIPDFREPAGGVGLWATASGGFLVRLAASLPGAFGAVIQLGAASVFRLREKVYAV